jgi:hypothetical protein
MTIHYATCFGCGKLANAFPGALGLYDSDMSSRDRFTGRAVQIVDYRKRLMDNLKQDGSTLTELYMAFRYEHNGDQANAHSICGLWNFSSGIPIFGIARSAGSPRELTAYRIDSGTTWTSLGTATGYPLPNNTVVTLEVYWKMSDTVGAVKIWMDGVEILNLSAIDTLPGSVSGATHWILGNVTSSSTIDAYGYFGELIIADAQIHSATQRKKFAVLTPNGAGASSQWTGAYGDVDEIPPNDTDKLYTNTASYMQLFTLTDLPSEAVSVDNVMVMFRHRSQGGPTPKKNSPIVRVTSGNIYGGYSQAAPSPNFRHEKYFWPQNPYTSAAWSVSEVNSLQAGVWSQT